MKRSLCGGFAAAIAFASTAAFADPVVILLDHRATTAGAQPSPDASFERRDATAADTLSSAVAVSDGPSSGHATATATSSFADPMHWFGTGASDVSWTASTHAFYYASAGFGVVFDITAPVAYSFGADFLQAHTNVESPSTSFGVAAVVLFHHLGGTSDTVFAFRTQPESASAVSRSFAGILVPGEYSLAVDATSSGSGRGRATASSGYRFTMDFAAADAAPVPEPASLLLLGTGLAGVFGYRRGSGKRRSTLAARNVHR